MTMSKLLAITIHLSMAITHSKTFGIQDPTLRMKKQTLTFTFMITIKIPMVLSGNLMIQLMFFLKEPRINIMEDDGRQFLAQITSGILTNGNGLTNKMHPFQFCLRMT